MRTTVTLDEDVAAALRVVAAERRLSFEDALNTTLRDGSSRSGPTSRPYTVPVRRLGLRQDVDLDKALSLAGALEDDGVVRTLSLRT